MYLNFDQSKSRVLTKKCILVEICIKNALFLLKNCKIAQRCGLRFQTLIWSPAAGGSRPPIALVTAGLRPQTHAIIIAPY